jgi:hypothetical protein
MPYKFIFDFSQKWLKNIHPLKLYQHTKFHGPIHTDENFAVLKQFCPFKYWYHDRC